MKMNRRLFLVLLLVTLLEGSMLFANGRSEHNMTVGLALSGIKSNAIFIDMARNTQRLCDEAGYKLLTADIQDGPDKVVTAMENFINAGCNIIIIQNYAEDACSDMMRKAVKNGIVIGSYDYTSDIAQYAVVCSNYEVGKIIGKECGGWVKTNPGSKKVAICSYSPLDFLVERERGMRDGFTEACPEGNIVITLDAGFPSDGVKVGENFLQAHPDIQAVMGINDGGCIGVYEAFKAAGLTKKNGVAIFGCDASVDGINAIKEDDMFKCTIDLDLVNQVQQLYERCLDTVKTGLVNESEKLIYYPINPIYLSNIGDLK